ncbi:MAG: hypothetical protein V8S95_13950 [Odoribacter sp.]
MEEALALALIRQLRKRRCHSRVCRRLASCYAVVKFAAGACTQESCGLGCIEIRISGILCLSSDDIIRLL